MTNTIYYHDFTTKNKNYRLCYYLNEGDFDTTVNFVKMHPKSVLFEDELVISKSMPDDLPIGLQLADSMKFKLNLYYANYPIEATINGYASIYNSQDYKNNIWYLLEDYENQWIVKFYGFQDLNDTNQLDQDLQEPDKLILDVECIGVHKYILEKLNFTTLANNFTAGLWDLWDEDPVESAKFVYSAYPARAEITIKDHYAADTTHKINYTTFDRFIYNVNTQISNIGKEFTCNPDFELTFNSADLIKHIDFYYSNEDGTGTLIENNIQQHIIWLCYKILDSEDEWIGGLLTGSQEKGWTEYDNLFDFFARLCENLVIRTYNHYVPVANNTDIPTIFNFESEKILDFSNPIEITSLELGSKRNMKNGGKYAVLNGNRKAVNEGDSDIVELKNVGIFNNASYELQEIINTNLNVYDDTNGNVDYYKTNAGLHIYATVEGTSANIRTLKYYNFGYSLTPVEKHIFDKNNIDIGTVKIQDNQVNFPVSELYGGTSWELMDGIYKGLLTSRVATGGLTFCALKAINYILAGSFIVDCVTKKEDLRVGQAANITDNLFKTKDTTFGSGEHIITNLEENYFGETKIKLFRRA